MKCKKCKFENIVKASYCHKCGNKFSDDEKEMAYKKTIYGKIETFEKWKDIISLDVITGNIVFKIVSLIVVLGIGLYFLFTMGINTKLLNSKDYKIFYNKQEDEYYLLVDDEIDSIDVSLYYPNRVKEMNVYHYNTDDSLIEKKVIDKKKNVELKAYNNDYYVLESEYSNKKKDEIKVWVYHADDISSK